MPTPIGWGIILSVIFCLMAGAIYSNNLLYLTSFVLLAMFALVMLMTHQNVKALSISNLSITSGFAGQGVLCWLSFKNETKTLRFHVEIKIYIRELGWVLLSPSSISVDNYETSSMGFKFSIAKRGQYQIRKVSLSSIYPFGLFRVWIYLPFEKQFLVYPFPAGQMKIPSSMAREAKGESEYYSSSPDEFLDLKNYIEGESLHKIHWSSFARHRQYLTKQMGEMGANIVKVHFRQIPLPLEEKLSQITYWILKARESGDLMLLVGYRDKPFATRSQLEYDQLLGSLATYEESA